MTTSSPTLNGLDLTTLRLLVAAVEEGNLGRAGEREHISVSSISRRITDLEARMKVPLLHRHDRGVTPTAAAAAVLPQIRDILGLLEHVVHDLADYAAGTRGVIRVRAHLTALAGSLPGTVRAFMAEHPGLEVEIEDSSSVEGMHAVRVGTADLALVSGTVEADDLQLIPWAQDEVAAVVPIGHDLAREKDIRFADLLAHPFIGMQRDSALLALYRRQAAMAGGALHERAHVTGFDMVRKLVGEGMGVSILPTAATGGDDRIAVRRLAEPWAIRPLMICVRELADASTATRMLVDHLLRAA